MRRDSTSTTIISICPCEINSCIIVIFSCIRVTIRSTLWIWWSRWSFIIPLWSYLYTRWRDIRTTCRNSLDSNIKMSIWLKGRRCSRSVGYGKFTIIYGSISIRIPKIIWITISISIIKQLNLNRWCIFWVKFHWWSLVFHGSSCCHLMSSSKPFVILYFSIVILIICTINRNTKRDDFQIILKCICSSFTPLITRVCSRFIISPRSNIIILIIQSKIPINYKLPSEAIAIGYARFCHGTSIYRNITGSIDYRITIGVHIPLESKIVSTRCTYSHSTIVNIILTIIISMLRLNSCDLFTCKDITCTTIVTCLGIIVSRLCRLIVLSITIRPLMQPPIATVTPRSVVICFSGGKPCICKWCTSSVINYCTICSTWGITPHFSDDIGSVGTAPFSPWKIYSCLCWITCIERWRRIGLCKKFLFIPVTCTIVIYRFCSKIVESTFG